jgi:hypothetical protein
VGVGDGVVGLGGSVELASHPDIQAIPTN